MHKGFSLFLFLFLLLGSSCSDPPPAPSPPRPLNDAPPTRIISLAPSITEVLFELDLGNKVVGVTRYCDYPLEASEKEVVGGYFDVNYEKVVSLQPDLIIHLVEHEDARTRLAELGLKTLSVNHSRVQGILESITVIADRCRVKKRGRELRTAIESRIASVQEKYLSVSPRLPTEASAKAGPRVPASDASLPRVLVAVGRLMENSSGGEVFISGRDGFYDDLISLAGGVNAYREETLKFPAVSNEGLVRLDPDIILEMVPDLAGAAERTSLMELWRSKPGVRAVREGHVYVLGEDYVVVPGPRFIDLLEDMVEIINSYLNDQ